jgi:hypothetical protein
MQEQLLFPEDKGPVFLMSNILLSISGCSRLITNFVLSVAAISYCFVAA